MSVISKTRELEQFLLLNLSISESVTYSLEKLFGDGGLPRKRGPYAIACVAHT